MLPSHYKYAIVGKRMPQQWVTAKAPQKKLTPEKNPSFTAQPDRKLADLKKNIQAQSGAPASTQELTEDNQTESSEDILNPAT